MQILIAEDQDSMGQMVQRWMTAIKKQWPDCRLILTTTLLGTLLALKAEPPPDVLVLDLTLTDSMEDNTLLHLDYMKTRSAVVILTGGSVTEEQVGVPVIKKGASAGDKLITAVAKAFLSRPNGPWAQSDESLRRMEDLLQKLHEPHAA